MKVILAPNCRRKFKLTQVSWALSENSEKPLNVQRVKAFILKKSLYLCCYKFQHILTPAAKEAGSLFHSYFTIAISSDDKLPFIMMTSQGKNIVLSPPALARGGIFSAEKIEQI